MSNKVMVLVGTKKGGFIMTSDAARQKWSMDGPHFAGAEVFHMVYDPRKEALLAAVNNSFWGPKVHISYDMGKTWEVGEDQPGFPEGGEMNLDQLWHLEPGRPSEPDVIYAGGAPASLFKSNDYGKSWEHVKGLNEHPSSDKWQPGFGGLCLHSMVLHPDDPNQMWVGISAVGALHTTDGGASWNFKNKGVRADFSPEPLPEYGQCVHKMLMHPSRPNTLIQQNHCGVYISHNQGEEWDDISEGLPSRFGFPLGLHSANPDCFYVIPEDKAVGKDVGGGKRFTTDAKLTVYRTTNGGKGWEGLSNGLPQENAYLNVLREGMTTDKFDDCGIYFGTTTGQIFYSANNGDSWNKMFDYLPPVRSMECGMLS